MAWIKYPPSGNRENSLVSYRDPGITLLKVVRPFVPKDPSSTPLVLARKNLEMLKVVPVPEEIAAVIFPPLKSIDETNSTVPESVSVSNDKTPSVPKFGSTVPLAENFWMIALKGSCVVREPTYRLPSPSMVRPGRGDGPVIGNVPSARYPPTPKVVSISPDAWNFTMPYVLEKGVYANFSVTAR
jgi:hypothetical protein